MFLLSITAILVALATHIVAAKAGFHPHVVSRAGGTNITINIHDAFVPILKYGSTSLQAKRWAQWHDRDDPQNLCTTDGQSNETSANSPDTSSCALIIESFSDINGYWSLGGWGDQDYIVLAYQPGDCEFGVTRTNGAGPAQIGNGDVKDRVSYAIDNYEGGGKVGAKGTLKCPSTCSLTSTKLDVDLNWIVRINKVA